MKRTQSPICLSILLSVMVACQGPASENVQAQQTPLPACEWCGADEASEPLNWFTTIAGSDEAGERLVVSGTVFQSDGKTPAPNVILYMYHTNNEGVYAKRGNETGNGRRHGYLRSWLRTNAQGQYRIETIRPVSYPGRDEPAHIHLTVKEPEKPEYYIDSIIFEDDPLVTTTHRARLKGRGGSGIISLTRDEQGIWKGTRDIILR